jgi:Rps23 Pro-64 3,4-dihydroxylase Tpa1-like proline 4-hydroxylase
LLRWILANESRFLPAKVIDGTGGPNSYDASIRSGLKLRDLGSFDPIVRERLMQVLPTLMRQTGTLAPAPTSLELELAAYGDGAHFSPHVDMAIGPGRKPLGARPGEDRVLSAVYYLHLTPKRFSEGQLRLFPFGTDPANCQRHISLDPIDNSLVAFPSWAMHEVLPVRCSTGAFADSRFSLNCWYCRTLSAPH